MTLLNQQRNANIRHEFYSLPWETNVKELYVNMCTLLQEGGTYIGDIAFYYINYIGEIMRVITPKIICLKRDKDEVIESFYNRNIDRNYWTDPKSEHWNWNKWQLSSSMLLFPKYRLDKRDAIAEYYDEYCRIAEYWAKLYPNNFVILEMETLNTEEGIIRILDHYEIENEDRVINAGIHKNRSDSYIKQILKLPDYLIGKIPCAVCDKKNAEWNIIDEKKNVAFYICGGCYTNDRPMIIKQEVLHVVA